MTFKKRNRNLNSLTGIFGQFSKNRKYFLNFIRTLAEDCRIDPMRFLEIPIFGGKRTKKDTIGNLISPELIIKFLLSGIPIKILVLLLNLALRGKNYKYKFGIFRKFGRLGIKNCACCSELLSKIYFSIQLYTHIFIVGFQNDFGRKKYQKMVKNYQK